MVSLDLTFEPMREQDLDWITEQERTLHVSPWSRTVFQDSINAGHTVWVARTGACPVGYAVTMHAAGIVELLNITIAAAEQGRGYGKSFLAFLCDRSVLNRAEAMFLEVRPSKAAAVSLYRNSGFKEVGRRKGYYPAEQGREDAIVMKKVLV